MKYSTLCKPCSFISNCLIVCSDSGNSAFPLKAFALRQSTRYKRDMKEKTEREIKQIGLDVVIFIVIIVFIFGFGIGYIAN
jgi:hypothetical protein